MDVIVIDRHDARRAQVRAMVECAGGAVAAYGDPGDFGARARWAPLYLVADESRALVATTILLTRFERPAYVVAYGDEPAIHDVIGALSTGASDYIAWPFGAHVIRNRLQTARAREASARRSIEWGAAAKRNRARCGA